MKTAIRILAIGFAGVLSPGLSVQAQVFNPKPQPAPAQGGSNNSSTTIVNRQSPQSGNNQVTGNDMPFFDPGSEMLMFDGRTWNVTNNRLFAARFEKYLNSPVYDTDEDKAYRQVIRDILDALSPHNQEPQFKRLARAVAMLQNASQFEQDAYLSESLANAVYRTYLAKKNVSDLQRLNVELDMQRRQLDWKFEKWNDPNRLSDGRRKLSESRQEENAAKQKDPTNTSNAGQVQRFVQRIAEVEASRVQNIAKMELSEVQSKLEFQGLIVQFFMQRRFEHVIMAARLYTDVFSDGNGELEFKDGSDVEKMFGESIGFNPTITTLDSLANEAIRDVDEGVQAFEFLVEQNKLDSATKRLSEAFAVGEYLPRIRTLDMEKKQKVSDYARMANQLISSLEVKDYLLAEELINKMRDQAVDFDHSKPMQAVEVAKMTSNMRIRTAKNAALKGEMEVYEENITAATEIWPTNPQLKEQFNILADNADVKSQAIIEMDRLISTQSYRQIFNDQARFIAATVDDPERQEQLQEIIGNIQIIEMALQNANALAKEGNKYAAWETVEKVFQRFPDDAPLGAKRSDLTTEVADFVASLKKAENLEEMDQAGSSLAWFLKSRQIYPNSSFAKEGIERLANKILPDGDNTSASVDGDPGSPDFGEIGDLNP